jgi:hypothetical protein
MIALFHIGDFSMRSVLIAALALCSISLSAQQSASSQPQHAKGWDEVRLLRAGTGLDIKLRHGGQKCAFEAADDSTLTCKHGADLIVQKADILRIKVHHRGRSTLGGLAIGAGTGAIIGFASSSPCNDNSFSVCVLGRGAVAGILGIAGGATGALTGYFTDFTRSVIYSAK